MQRFVLLIKKLFYCFSCLVSCNPVQIRDNLTKLVQIILCELARSGCEVTGSVARFKTAPGTPDKRLRAPPKIKVSSVASESMVSTPHILIVDDDPLICEQLEQLYTNDGYRV